MNESHLGMADYVTIGMTTIEVFLLEEHPILFPSVLPEILIT